MASPGNSRKKNWPARLLSRVAALKESESAQEIREELAAEKRQEKKPLAILKKILIGIAVLLVVSIPALVKLFWTVSGYFANKP